MKSFKNYAKETPKNAHNTANESASAEDLIKKLANEYDGTSNADMLAGILAEAEKSKRAGTLSNEVIENFIKPFRLCSIVVSVKNYGQSWKN